MSLITLFAQYLDFVCRSNFTLIFSIDAGELGSQHGVDGLALQISANTSIDTNTGTNTYTNTDKTQIQIQTQILIQIPGELGSQLGIDGLAGGLDIGAFPPVY